MGVRVVQIPASAEKDRVTLAVHKLVSRLPPHPSYPAPVNFEFYLVRAQGSFQRHAGYGFLTFPDASFDEELIHLARSYPLVVDGVRLVLDKARRADKDDVVRRVRENVWRDPRTVQAERAKEAELQSPVAISSIGWGLECRDGVYSLELDKPVSRGQLVVDSDKKRLDILAPGLPTIHIPLHSIFLLTDDRDASPPCAYLSLHRPPSLDTHTPLKQQSGDPLDMRPVRRALDGDDRPWKSSFLDDAHARISPYLNDIRIVFPTVNELDAFLNKAGQAHLDGQRRLSNSIPVAYRQLYSQHNLDTLDRWYKTINITLAMACAALVSNSMLDPAELLSVRHDILNLVRDRRLGVDGTEQALVRLQDQRWRLNGGEDEDGVQTEAVPLKALLAEIAHEVADGREAAANAKATRPSDDDDDEVGLFKCFHLIHTPSAFFISPRQAEKTNRIVRKYSAHQGRFLRVNFRSEDHQPYRFDRDVKYADFLSERVGQALKEGIRVAGRRWEWVGYSGSSLQEHSAWFFSPARDRNGRHLDAHVIRAEMGDFDKESYYPARLGARQSQTFTSTDPSIVLLPHQILEIDDVERKGYCFTDGAGTISSDLTKDIWNALRRQSGGGATRRKQAPSCFQIRLGGWKGMLTVDHRLNGKVVCLRSSMDKFSSPGETEVEIAKYFTKAAPAMLNQPLVKILEELGIRAQVVLDLQRDAANAIKAAEFDLGVARTQLEMHGLGTAFKIPSILGKLAEAGISLDVLTGKLRARTGLLATALYNSTIHVLRELKSKARIPVPGSVTLVGVPDEWGLLREGEIYASTTRPGSKEITWIEGPVCISRSPTVHVGDVRMARAIGKPPAAWMETVGRVRNAVVFSVERDRPLMHMLGGGDADGDEYVLLLNPGLHPRRIYTPATYAPAEKLCLSRPATFEDVADHFTNYMASDILGVIAIQLLNTSDVSLKGMLDPDCLILAELANIAVDFNKSGIPVPMHHLPDPQAKSKPNFLAPEGLNSADLTGRYRDSNHLLGRLWKAIEIPPPLTDKPPAGESAAGKKKKKKGKKPAGDGKQSRRRSRSANAADAPTIPADPSATPLHAALLSHLATLPFPSPLRLGPLPAAATLVASRLAIQFCADLSTLASVHSLELWHRSSSSSDTRLSEAEVFIGTILSTTSQPRLRRNTMATMREKTAMLVKTTGRGMRNAARGESGEDGEAVGLEELGRWAEVAWACWVESERRRAEGEYGAESFGWVAIGAMFDAEDKILTFLDELDSEDDWY